MFGAEGLLRKALARRPLLCFVALFLLVFGLQWTGGAFRADFTGHDDEAAHFVTGLMVRDYLASGLSAPPREFAENYYFHYPKVAIGHWPPFFYVVQAIWMLVLPPSRFTIMLLMTSISAVLAWLVYLELRREIPDAIALTGGAILVALPLVQAHTGMVMAEMLLALLVLLASFAFARYLEHGRARDAIWFGVFAAMAILTKPIGVILAAVPPVAVALLRRFDLLRRLSFWAPAAIVIAPCAPWYFIVDRAFHESWTAWGGVGIFEDHWRVEARQWHAHAGKALLVFAGLGVLSVLVSGLRSRKVHPRWAVAAGVLVGFFVFRTYVGASHEIRSLLVALPAFMMFVARGAATAAGRLTALRLRPAVATGGIVAVLGVSFLGERFRLIRRPPQGFAEAAADLAARRELRDSVVLVSSLLGGEGAFIAEVALRERRPGRVVLRATKALASAGWAGHNYRLRLHSSREVAAFLEAVPVGVVVWDRAQGDDAMKHHEMLLEALRAQPGRWEPIGFYPAQGSPRLEVYRQVGHEGRPRSRIRLDVRRRLGKILER